jgi:hypothetical protein
MYQMEPGLLFVFPLLLTLWFFARLGKNHWLKDRFLERLYADRRDLGIAREPMRLAVKSTRSDGVTLVHAFRALGVDSR